MKPIIRLLLINTSWTLALSVASNFLSAWFWDIGTGLSPIIGFYATLFLVTIASFGLATRLKRLPSSVALMATGILVNALFLGSLLILRTDSRHFYLPLAILEGASVSFYWLALYVLASAWVRPDQARWYNSWSGTLEAILGLVVPPLSGWLIASFAGLAGYRLVFAIAFISLLGAFILILGANRSARTMAVPPPPEVRDSDPIPERWRSLLWSFWALGLRDGIYLFLPNLLLFIVSRSTIWLGVFAACQAGLQGLVFWVVGRWPQLNHHSRSLGFATGLSLFALALIALPLELSTIFGLGLLVSIAYPPFKVSLESSALMAIGGNQRSETAMMRRTGQKEVWLNSGRLLSLLLVLGFVLWLPHFRLTDFRFVLAAWGLSPVAIWLFYRKVTRAEASH